MGHWLIVLGFEVNRAKIVEGAMEALAVIESFDEVEDCQASLGASFEATPISCGSVSFSRLTNSASCLCETSPEK